MRELTLPLDVPDPDRRYEVSGWRNTRSSFRPAGQDEEIQFAFDGRDDCFDLAESAHAYYLSHQYHSVNG